MIDKNMQVIEHENKSSELIMKTIFCWPNLKQVIINQIILSNQGPAPPLPPPHFESLVSAPLQSSSTVPGNSRNGFNSVQVHREFDKNALQTHRWGYMLPVKYNLITTKPDLQAVGDEGGGGGMGGTFYSSCFKGGGHNKCDYKFPKCPEVK